MAMKRGGKTTLWGKASLLAALAWTATQAQAIDLGEPSVLSQRGQRLNIAVPYGSNVGEHVGVNRFVVRSVTVPEGFAPIHPSEVSIAAPEHRNLVMLRTASEVKAPWVQIEFGVADGPELVRYNLFVPPEHFAASEPVASPRAGKASVRSAKARSRNAPTHVAQQ